MGDITHNLRDPFDYAAPKGGEMVTAQFVTLFPPTYRHLQHVAPIKQAFMAALTSIQVTDEQREAAKKEERPDEDISPDAAIQLLYSGPGDMSKVMVHAAELFKAGAILIDGEIRATQPMIDKMSGHDFEQVLGAYMANFIVTSLKAGA